MIGFRKLGFFKKKEHDVLKTKEERLRSYIHTFDTVVSTVNRTIDILTATSDQISSEIEEIEAYQAGLNATIDGLKDARGKNDKVIRNFRTLIGEECE